MERFQRTVLDEFFRLAFRTKLYETVEALQADLDTCLQDYNYQRPHQGYRNLGKRPFERIEEFVVERRGSAPAFSPPAAPEDQPGAQPQSRAFSEAALDGGEHRVTIDPGAGGNGSSGEIVKVLKSRE